MNKNISIIASIMLSLALFFAYTNLGSALAQNQSSSTNKTLPQNQTSATVTGKAQTTTINKTSIPAEQTTVEVNKTAKPVEGQANLKPLSNQSMQQQVPSLSGIQNKTIVQATGPATSEIVNKTTVPYNQTKVGTENTSKSLQSQQASQQNQTGQSQSQKSQNQSKGPLEQLGSSVGNLLGGKK